MVSCQMVSEEGDVGGLTDPVCLGDSVDGTNKERERTASGEKKGAANEHSQGEGGKKVPWAGERRGERVSEQ
jgi:hypothetical protein